MLSIKEIKVKLYTALARSKTRVVSACVPSFNTTKEIPIMRIRIHSTNLVQSCFPDMPVGYESACLSVDKEQEVQRKRPTSPFLPTTRLMPYGSLQFGVLCEIKATV
jgi:hypothetical protein